jgi:hypothetical protein
MCHASVRLISSVLVIVLFIAGPAGLEAKGRRGALIIITKVDGVQVKGELFSVKPESLLVLRRGAALTIPRGMVHSVSIQRRSGLARGALSGFATGAILGFLLGSTYNDHFHSNPAVPVGAVAGGLGLAIGMVASRREKVESVVPLSGLSGPAANERWNALGAHSRKGRAKGSARRP